MRIAIRLGTLAGLVLVNLDVWHAGRSPAGWSVRVIFNGLLLWQLVLSRGEIGKLLPSDHVLARARGRRRWPWQSVAVIFTQDRAVAFKRSLLSGRIRKQLAEDPYGRLEVSHSRHGALFDRIRCRFSGGLDVHLRLVPSELSALSRDVTVRGHAPAGPLAHAADWVRAGTTYED
jgi:hypothetical protein